MVYSKDTALKVAEYLLEIKAIKLNPQEMYTWASGMKSPIYCDNRISLAYPEVRSYIRDGFVSIYKDMFSDVNLIAGVATAGIAHGALLAEALDLPFCYVRSKAKTHGTQSLIEGRLNPGDKVLVVEDLFSTGGSAVKAIKALKEEGAVIEGALAIFNYGFSKVDNAFAEIKTPFYTLSNFESLLYLIEKSKQYEGKDLLAMKAWYSNH
ncbi:MAG: orotate phosphoribosyltransferase [Chitinophagales bacterium]|jgi:orotate phosphoribosyltransferase|tara:strand:- start:11559 stop:12185 length:627 start_codon:yes stop_codon:yes gene_type:complete